MKYFYSSTLGCQIFLLLSLTATIAGISYYGFEVQELALVLSGYFLYGCLGIVVTFHRYLTHNSYKTRPIFTKLFSLLGCFSGTGSPLAWVAIHINHHRKSDKPGDPHSPHFKGYKIFTLSYDQEIDSNTKWKMRKIVTDRYQQFLHRFYFLLILSYDLILFLLGGIYFVIFFHLVPALITALMSNVVNYVGHKPNWIGGFRTYNLGDKSSNNWLWAIPSWGESWHNNHHRHPRNFSLGEKWWQIDISAIVIRLIKTN